MNHDLHRLAVQCATEGRLSALSDPAQFDVRTVCGALHFALLYSRHDDPKASGHVSPAQARAILHAQDCPEPVEAAHLHQTFMRPSICKPYGSKAHWPINAAHGTDRSALVWGLILGIERGAFAYDRSGHLQWTQAGRDRFEAGDGPTMVDSLTGQSAFAF